MTSTHLSSECPEKLCASCENLASYRCFFWLKPAQGAEECLKVEMCFLLSKCLPEYISLYLNSTLLLYLLFETALFIPR